MSVLMETTHLSRADTPKSKATQLSDKDVSTGVRILRSLQTVIRAERLRDPYVMAAQNVVKNEQRRPEFSRYIEKVAGCEAEAQQNVVAELLAFCYKVS